MCAELTAGRQRQRTWRKLHTLTELNSGARLSSRHSVRAKQPENRHTQFWVKSFSGAFEER